MPEVNNPGSQVQSPFEVVTTAKKKQGGNSGVIIAVLVVVLLGLGIFFGIRLIQQNQGVKEKTAASSCPGAEACPYAKDPTLLRNCTPPNSDNTPQDSQCNTAGRVEACGGVQYCCPAPGSPWTTNLSSCATPTPISTIAPTSTATPIVDVINSSMSPTPTATPTHSGTGTPKTTSSPTIAPLVAQTSTPTATATSTGQSVPPTPTPTDAPIPVTGASWPTIVAAGLGLFLVIGSVLLAL